MNEARYWVWVLGFESWELVGFGICGVGSFRFWVWGFELIVPFGCMHQIFQAAYSMQGWKQTYHTTKTNTDTALLLLVPIAVQSLMLIKPAGSSRGDAKKRPTGYT